MTPAKSARKTTAAAPRKAATSRKTAATGPSAKPPEVKPMTPKTPLKTAAAKTEKKKDKPEKLKVVRDSFTIPKNEYSQISELKKRAIAGGVEVKKSELIRAGLLLLSSQTDAGLIKALNAVPTLKTGRPGKG